MSTPPPNPQPPCRVRVIMLCKPNEHGTLVVPRQHQEINDEIAQMENDGWLVVNVDQARVVLQRPMEIRPAIKTLAVPMRTQ